MERDQRMLADRFHTGTDQLPDEQRAKADSRFRSQSQLFRGPKSRRASRSFPTASRTVPCPDPQLLRTLPGYYLSQAMTRADDQSAHAKQHFSDHGRLIRSAGLKLTDARVSHIHSFQESYLGLVAASVVRSTLSCKHFRNDRQSSIIAIASLAMP